MSRSSDVCSTNSWCSWQHRAKGGGSSWGPSSCFYKFGVLFVGVRKHPTVCVLYHAPDFWKLPESFAVDGHCTAATDVGTLVWNIWGLGGCAVSGARPEDCTLNKRPPVWLGVRFGGVFVTRAVVFGLYMRVLIFGNPHLKTALTCSFILRQPASTTSKSSKLRHPRHLWFLKSPEFASQGARL